MPNSKIRYSETYLPVLEEQDVSVAALREANNKYFEFLVGRRQNDIIGEEEEIYEENS